MGEDIAVKFLMKHGFSVIDRNYTKKWGEIDIIAEKEDKLYFIEVKSVSRTLTDGSDENGIPDNQNWGLAAKSGAQNFFQPEENMHPWKRRRLARVVETYLISKRIGNTPWQFDVLLVFVDTKQRKARVRTIENIIL